MELSAQKDFEELLLKATQYSGSRKSGEKVISASSINREPYFLLVQHLFDKQEQLSYGANTTGSLYQLGLDSALASHGNGRWRTAQRLQHILPNGWTISGEYDIFDTETNTIIDGKVMTAEEIITLAKLPSRQELLGMLAGALLGNISKLAVGLNEVCKQKENV